jgi:hypothetical protein
MNAQRSLLLLATSLATLAAAAGTAAGQQTPTAFGQADSGPQSTTPAASVPDFSGIWRHGSLPWFVPPASGPGPVTNRSRQRDSGVSDYGQLVGDYANPILQPWAAEVVKKKGELSLAGLVFPSPANQCWPEPMPFLFKHMAMQMLQLPDRVVMLFSEDHVVRRVRLNQPHPAQLTPSWYGDSVGRYDGDTLLIDTVGIRTGPLAMVDVYGTPFTEALHVVERYRLLDYEAAKEAQKRGGIENAGVGNAGWVADPDYKGKGLQLQFTIEDMGAFTMPWSALITYRRPSVAQWEEIVCAENPHEYYAGKITAVPTADKPDF